MIEPSLVPTFADHPFRRAAATGLLVGKPRHSLTKYSDTRATERAFAHDIANSESAHTPRAQPAVAPRIRHGNQLG